jgi:predicted ribosomally synthesized peptide with SipW-like signal peptide
LTRRKVLRSWLTATLLVLAGTTGVLVASPSAEAADRIVVYVRDDGFSQTDIHAIKGDELIFQLDDAAMKEHRLAWEAGYVGFQFSRQNRRTYVRYGPLNPGTLHFYDSSQLQGPGPHPPGPFSGTLTVHEAAPPPTTTSSSSTSTTVTTQPTTTTTQAPTTSTTAPTSVRPFLVPDPAPTTTTTVAANLPTPPTTAAPATKDKAKDKSKDKTASPSTPTTAAPAPPDTMPPDFIFDPAALTPSPTLTPDAPPTDSGDEAALNASAAANLLDNQKSDDKKLLLLMALAALALMLLVGGTWAWFTRSSQYDPA